MTDDPIVAEVRAARAKLMRECGNDLNKLFERIKQMEAEHPERMITSKQLDAQRKQRVKAHGPPRADSGRRG